MWQRIVVLLAVLQCVVLSHADVCAADTDSIVGPIPFVYAEHDSVKLYAHVFRPFVADSGLRRPAIVVFHGGGWVMGEASWSFSRAKRFARRGVVSIAAQYRISNQKDVTPLEAMADARAIIKWVRLNADSLGIDRDRIAAFGWSAGAHLAASAAIFPDSGQTFLETAPNALILDSPALHLTGDKWVKTLLADRAAPEDISPAAHVRANMPPTLIQVGETDTVTPLKGARLFYERMRAAGNVCVIQVYPGVGHLFTPSHLPDDGWPQPDSAASALANSRVDSFLVDLGYYR